VSLRVAIAGGGIIGLSIAWRLAQAGFAVSVFEKGSMGGEASWAGAGMLAPGGEIDNESELASLCLESRRLYRDFIRELEADSGFGIDFQERGALDVAYTADERDALDTRAARQAEMGIQSKPVTPARVAAFWPRVRTEGLLAARFYPDDAVVNPREVVLALCAACRKLGVSLWQKCAVQQAEPQSAGMMLVTTCSQTELYDAFVNAAGAWSGQIAIANISLPPAEPVKGHLIGYQQPEHTCDTIIRHRHAYLLQRAGGLLIAGASVEHVGFDRDLNPAIAESLAAQASFILPHLRETTFSEVWTGLRPGSDALHIGRWQTDRLYLAYGHYRNGILLAPVTAERITAEISANLRRP